jgi:hypothetical protein
LPATGRLQYRDEGQIHTVRDDRSTEGPSVQGSDPARVSRIACISSITGVSSHGETPYSPSGVFSFA